MALFALLEKRFQEPTLAAASVGKGLTQGSTGDTGAALAPSVVLPDWRTGRIRERIGRG